MTSKIWASLFQNKNPPDSGGSVLHPDLEKNEPAPTGIGTTPLRDIPNGYSYVAAYADGRESAPVFRRFGALKARVLLTQQAELEQKEKELAEIDFFELEEAEDHDDTYNMKWLAESKSNDERKKLITDIAARLRRYEKDIILYRQIRHFPQARKWQKENLKSLLDHKGSIYPGESEFIEKDDLISMMKEADDVAELSEWVSNLRRKIFPLDRFKWIFETKKKAVYDGTDEIVLYSQKWMRTMSRVLFGIIVAGVLSLGVITLYYVHVNNLRLLVLFLSTLVCAIATAVFTTAKKSEVFAVSAAYCAVLVVFVGSTLDKNNQVALQLGNTWINGTVSG
ncbi:hypothetical protein TWF481_007567 [Arthrobotrys musiformis]|uniref:DUF6594 domain-containing protein n=1 Tax=Arthrobotrys musiformis TaxID=47236 RepID=A0AAV9WCQ1_9PEZI